MKTQTLGVKMGQNSKDTIGFAAPMYSVWESETRAVESWQGPGHCTKSRYDQGMTLVNKGESNEADQSNDITIE